MSSTKISLCSYLLKSFFGEPVRDVGTYLMQQPCKRPLALIIKNVNLLKSQVVLQKIHDGYHYGVTACHKVVVSLRVLLMHDLAEVSESTRGFIEYGVDYDKILKLLYQPRYIDYVIEKFGDIAGILFTKITEHGKMTIDQIITQTINELQLRKIDGKDFNMKTATEVKDIFSNLVQSRLLRQTAQIKTSPEAKKRVPDLNVSASDVFHIPVFDLQSLIRSGEPPPVKKKKVNETEALDTIYWGINHQMFQLHFRNQAIVDAASVSIDSVAAEVVKAAFKLSESTSHLMTLTTSHIGFHPLLQNLRKPIKLQGSDKSISMNEQLLKCYLSVLTKAEECFMSKTDDKSGGMYIINTSEILEKIVRENAAAVVQDRFGSKYSRIFRLILKNKYLEQKQIEEMSMIPPKDAKEHVYQMLKEKFITTQEISKTPDYAPSRTIYLFHVDITKVSRMLLQRCYHGALNILNAHDTQIKDQRRVLEKKQKLDAVIAELELIGDEEQIEDVRQMMTPQEQAAVDKVASARDTFVKGLNELTETILLLETYLLCANMR